MNTLTRTQSATGSLQDIMQKTNRSLAQLYQDVRLIVIADVSGSMHAHDVGVDGQSRADRQNQILADLQKDCPGKVLLVEFGAYARVRLTGRCGASDDGRTDYLPPLQLAQPLLTSRIRVAFITDGGLTDDENTVANYLNQHYRGKLDFFYAGPSQGRGWATLQRLAKIVNGSAASEVLARASQTLQTLRLGAGNGNQTRST